jgi:hypothetical protein
MDPFGIVPIRETERMPRVQPAMVGMPTVSRFVKNRPSFN